MRSLSMLRNPQSVMLVPKLTSTTASCFTPALLRARHLPFSVCASSLSAVTQYQHSRSHYFAHNTFKFTGTSTTPFNDHEQDRGNNDYHPNDDDSDNHVYDHGDHSNSKNNRTSRSNKNSANHTNYTHNNYTLHHNLHHSNNEKYKHKYKHTRKQHCKRAAEIGTPTIGLRWFSSRGAKTPTAMMAGTSSTPKHAQHAQYNNDSKAGRTDTVLGVGAAAPPFVVKGSSGALLSTEDVFGALLYRYPPLYEVKKNPKLWKKHPQYCFKLVARNVGYDSAAVIGRVPGAFASADFTFTTEQSVKSFLDQVQTLMDKQEGGKVGKGEGGTDSTVSLMCQGELIEPSLPFSVLLDTDLTDVTVNVGDKLVAINGGYNIARYVDLHDSTKVLASYGLLLLLFLLLVVAWESAKSYNPDILDHIATPCQGEREEAELGQGKSDHSSAHSIDYETHPWKQVKIEMESTVDHQGDGRIQTAKYGGY